MAKQKDVIYPIRIDPEVYEKIKQYAKEHGKQSIRSVISYALSVFVESNCKG